MHQVFELFVARYLAEHFSEDQVYDVAIKPQIWLDAEQKERGEPDIVLRRYGQPFSILDTKYKSFDKSPSRDDVNQMYMYCGTMGVPRATLIYPNEFEIDSRTRYERMILDAIALPLSGSLDTFRERCRQFAAQFMMDQQTAHV